MDILARLEGDFTTQQAILTLISKIDHYRGKWELTEVRDNKYLKELRRISTIQSIGSSTRIEGVEMTDKEITELLKNLKITDLKTRDEQEVVGYYEALQVILENFSDTPLTENQIQDLHNILLKFSSKDSYHRGNYKKLSNSVVANYPGEEQQVIFQSTEPHLTEPEMHTLVRWTNEQFDRGVVHPLLVIASFIYEFLSIHPFQDGNGRLARLLTNFLLLKRGYVFLKYISFEHVIEERKKDYYEALMHGQKNRGSAQEKINVWVLFFLNCLLTLTERLDEKYSSYRSRGGYLNERQKKILDCIMKNEPIKLSDISEAFQELSVNTIKKDLQHLKAENYVEAIGEKKGTVYVSKKRN